MYRILPTPRLSARIGGIGRVYLAPRLNRGNFTDEKAGNAIRAFIDYADRVFGLIFVTTEETGEGILTLERDDSLPAEGYALIASPDGSVKIAAGDAAGLNHGFSSFLLSAEKDADGLSLPIMHICDEPQTEMRALMVDLVRPWNPLRFFYDVIDLCRLYKINGLSFRFRNDAVYTEAELAAIREYAEHRSVMLLSELDSMQAISCVTTSGQSLNEVFEALRLALPMRSENLWNISSDLSEEYFRELFAHTDHVLEAILGKGE